MQGIVRIVLTGTLIATGCAVEPWDEEVYRYYEYPNPYYEQMRIHPGYVPHMRGRYMYYEEPVLPGSRPSWPHRERY